MIDIYTEHFENAVLLLHVKDEKVFDISYMF